MSRDYKNLIKDNYYHIYNRGHNYQNIFLDDQDYHNFLKRLLILLNVEPVLQKRHTKGSPRLTQVPNGSFDILAYCLMPNHFHFLIKQNTNLRISVLINRLCTSYCRYFNAKNSRVGSLFQDTFKAKIIENDSYLVYLSAYIHNNPDVLSYPYSSFNEYMRPESATCNKNLILSMFKNSPRAYKDFVVKSKATADKMFGSSKWGQR